MAALASAATPRKAKGWSEADWKVHSFRAYSHDGLLQTVLDGDVFPLIKAGEVCFSLSPKGWRRAQEELDPPAQDGGG